MKKRKKRMKKKKAKRKSSIIRWVMFNAVARRMGITDLELEKVFITDQFCFLWRQPVYGLTLEVCCGPS